MLRACLVAGVIAAVAVGGPGSVHGQEANWTATDIASVLRAAPEHRIGALDGTRCETLGRIRDAAFAGDGRAVVIDGLAQSVSVFDTRGRCVYQIGRKGSGPGEFKAASKVTISGTTLHVLDPGNSRIERFELGTAAGKHVASLRLPLWPTDFCLGEDGTVLAGSHEGAILHRTGDDGGIRISFGELYDGTDGVRFEIAGPGSVLCRGDGSVTVTGFQVADVHQYGPRNDRTWATRIPGFLEMELIMDGGRVKGFRPSSEGFHYVATLLDLGGSTALVQIGTPTDVGYRRMESFVLDLDTGTLRSFAERLPHVFDIRGDLVLVDAEAEFPQLAIYRR